MLECLNALVQADPDAATMTLLRKSRLAPDAAAKLPFYAAPGYRGDAEITPLNILNACLKQAGHDTIGYRFDEHTGQMKSFVSKSDLTYEEILTQYEGEYLALPRINNKGTYAALLKDGLVLKRAKDYWDVYSGVDFEAFRDLVLSIDPDPGYLKDRPYERVKEEPK